MSCDGFEWMKVVEGNMPEEGQTVLTTGKLAYAEQDWRWYAFATYCRDEFGQLGFSPALNQFFELTLVNLFEHHDIGVDEMTRDPEYWCALRGPRDE